ncbi:MAG: M13 family metallopeptidase [Thermoplasmatales archaeon]
MTNGFNIETIQESEKPERPMFSTDYMDLSVNPFHDFYHFSNGNWLATHPVPKDKPTWGTFMQLWESNIYVLGKILEECALAKVEKDPLKAKLGDMYISIMNVDLIEKLKFDPIKPLMDEIESIEKKDEIAAVTSKLHYLGIFPFFSYDSSNDARNSAVYALYLNQPDLSLPNRDYYFLETFQDIRDEFRRHMERLFGMYGFEDASHYSDVVFNIETMLAAASRRPEELRDPEKNYTKVEKRLLANYSSALDIEAYLSRINLPRAVNYVIIGQPEFFRALDAILKQVSLNDWKVFLKWNVLKFSSRYLHKEAYMEYFNFYERRLTGKQEPEKRWKFAVRIIDQHLGEALGRVYVEREFSEKSKRMMEELVYDLKEVFAKRLKELDWMTEETKSRALEKFRKFRAKIGYPSKFIDYSSVEIGKDDFFGNIMRTNSFKFRREIERIGAPIDRELWLMTPPTINAYFHPTDNEIVFPAGILQPPFFDHNVDPAVNYGAIGGVIAHEITHGFDDQGRKFDADGNLKDWWRPEDERMFNQKAKEISSLYSSIEIFPGLKVNGELTMGENIADIGGVSIAFEALQRRLAKNPELRKNVDGFTPEQRFFIAWSQIWKQNEKEELTKLRLTGDPHSPSSVRGSLPVRVHEAFDTAFYDYKTKGSPEYPKIKIW